MEFFTFLVSLVCFIITVIVLVKFFQVASDVKKIRESTLKSDSFAFLINNGYKEEAKRALLSQIWEDNRMKEMRNVFCNKEEFNKYYEELKTAYKNHFKLLDEEFPTYEIIARSKKA